MPNIQRPIKLSFRVTEEELALIHTKMEQFGTDNMSAYLRKIAIDGYVVKLDLAELRKLTSLLGHIGGNINQIAKRVNSTHRIYHDDLEEIKQMLGEIWTAVKTIVLKLAAFT